MLQAILTYAYAWYGSYENGTYEDVSLVGGGVSINYILMKVNGILKY